VGAVDADPCVAGARQLERGPRARLDRPARRDAHAAIDERSSPPPPVREKTTIGYPSAGIVAFGMVTTKRAVSCF
jgi:hypothetical protein